MPQLDGQQRQHLAKYVVRLLSLQLRGLARGSIGTGDVVSTPPVSFTDARKSLSQVTRTCESDLHPALHPALLLDWFIRWAKVRWR